jgi:hypothetical protein
VAGGYDIVKKIEGVAIGSSDKPKEEQKIIKAYIEQNNAKEGGIK